MIVDIGNILVDLLQELPFVDKIAGIVKPLVYKDESTNQKKIFPVSCNINEDDCLKGKRYLDLCPDSTKKSVIYLEDNGVRLISRDQRFTTWKASVDLVGWLNLPALGVSGCSYSSIAIMGILSKFPIVPFNVVDAPLSIYQRLNIQVQGERQKSQNPFQKYSYDETVNQFLLFPYDYFVLPIEIEFMIDWRCLKVSDLNPSIDCLKK